MNRAGQLLIRADGAEVAKEAAALMVDAMQTAIAERGVARVALSGGSTPGPAYNALADARGVDWSKVHWFWVDERCVPADDPRSNFAAAKRDLLDRIGAAASTVHRMRGELPPSAAATTYEATLCAKFGVSRERALDLDADGRAGLSFDLVVAGAGTDGHTASLFPGTGAVGHTSSLVTDVEPGGDLEPRVTLTRPVLVGARRTLVLCRGRLKAPVIRAAREAGDEESIPARLYLDARPGSVTWIADRDAEPRDSIPPMGI